MIDENPKNMQQKKEKPLFFWVRAISLSISDIFSKIPIFSVNFSKQYHLLAIKIDSRQLGTCGVPTQAALPVLLNVIF